MALQQICEDENLDQKQFSNLIDTSIFTGQEPLREDAFQCLENRPSVLAAKAVADRIIDRMKEFVVGLM